MTLRECLVVGATAAALFCCGGGGGARAPAAPTDVLATPGDSRCSVSWTPPADGGSPILGYRVTASPGAVTTSIGPDSRSDVAGLVNGTAYTFTVVAFNAVGPGAASAPSNSATPAATAARPQPPVNVAAVAGDGAAIVSWTAGADGGSPISGYRVIASPGGSAATTSGATTATVGGLSNGTPYTFTVTASNAIGASAPSSPSAAVTPAGGRSAPMSAASGGSLLLADGSGIAIPAGALAADTTITITSVVASLTLSSATRVGDAVQLGPEGISLAQPAIVTLAFDPSELPPGKTAAQIAIFTAASGSSVFSPLATTVADSRHVQASTGHFSVFVAAVANAPASAPSSPTNIVAVAGDAQATVSWNASDDHGSPILYYTVTSDPDQVSVQTTQTSTVVGPLSADGSRYSFRVVATNAVGSSALGRDSPSILVSRQPSPWVDVTGSTGGLFKFVSEGAQTRIFGGGPAGVFFSDDEGRSWSDFNTGLPASARAAVSSLAVIPVYPFPSTASQLFVGASLDTSTAPPNGSAAGVYQTRTNGPAWTLAGNGLPHGGHPLVSTLAMQSSLWLGQDVGQSDMNNCYVSGDQGQSWSSFDLNSFPLHSPVRQFIEFNGIPYAAIFGEGVWQLSGSAWIPAGFNGPTEALYDDGNALAIVYNTLFLGTTFHGVQRSQTGLNDWAPATGLNLSQANIRAMVAVGSRLYIGLAEPSSACTYCPTMFGVFYSDDVGAHWRVMDAGLPEQSLVGVQGLYADGQVVLVQYKGRLYRTEVP